MNDFSDRPFAAGTLRGIRSFRATTTGEVTGVFHKHPWTPGENTADCCIRRDGAFAMTVCGMTVRPPSDHRAGSLTCLCGYYAYFDRENNPYHHSGQVLGIVEGYGLMSVGARGFRCEKARIVAFIDEAAEMPLRILLARWAFTRTAAALRLGQAKWPDTTVPFAVRRRYPDVPVIRGVAAAVARFPLIPPERPREAAA